MSTRTPALAGVTALALLLSVSSLSYAVTITVDTLSDDAVANGNCTFREAIQAANTNLSVDGCAAGSGADEIVLEVVGAIQLTADLPAVTESVSIFGPGPDELEIRGDVAFLPMYRLLSLQGGSFIAKTFVVRGLALIGGFAPSRGGGIEIVSGTNTTLEFVKISSCWADSYGGGIAIGGGAPTGATSQVTIRWSTIEANQLITAGVGGGGGISVEGVAELNLENSTVYLNETLGNSVPGGGIYIGSGGNLDATVNIRRSTLRGNATAARKGGGVYARTIGTIPGVSQAINLTVEHSTITGNATGGGSFSVDNEGGGFYLIGDDTAVTFLNNIVADNTVLGGLAVNEDVATPAVNGTVVVASGGYNFISEANTLPGFPPGNPNGSKDYVLFGGDPGLLAIGDYGGPTWTQPPASAASAVVDQGSCEPEPFDQRGYGSRSKGTRRVDIDSVTDADDGCDVGAVEFLGGDPDAGPLADYDGDGEPDDLDNCVTKDNPGQENLDGDALGNVCDPDVDNDGIFNTADPDDDDDGMTDTHEATWPILDPFDDSDAGTDPDGDNLTSLEEFNLNPGLDPGDPDTDDDAVDDRLDNAPLVSNNPCGGVNATFADLVSSITVCGASSSITVGSPAAVKSSGDLRFVSPAVVLESLTVEGDMEVFNSLPCAACP